MNVRRLGSVLGLVVSIAIAGWAEPVSAQGRPSLIAPSERNGVAATERRGAAIMAGDRAPGTTRTRDVRPSTIVVQDALDSLQRRPGQPVELDLDFFEDTRLTLILDRVERLGRGVTNFYGRVHGDPLGSAVITQSRGTMGINVFYLDNAYQVLYRGNGRYVAQEIDRKQLTDGDNDDAPVPPQSKMAADAPAVLDGAGTIDVMVLYTPEARAAVGGTAAMESEIDMGIAVTNQAYANSGVTQRVNLVHTAEIAYAPDAGAHDIGVALGHLTNGTNGLSGVAALRNAYGADLVSFWVQNGTGGCGVGWLMTTNSTAFHPNGYNIVLRGSCAVANQSFAHELGHNMGLHHDLYVAPQATNPTFAPYAHGYVNLPNRFRTIMAYNDQCAATPPGTGCTRINNFASPLVNYSGVPTGLAATADTTRALNDTAISVANFRTAIPAAGSIEMRFSTQTVAEGVGTAQVAVARLGGSLGAVSINYSTSNGTAIAGTDYSSATGTLNWADGDAADKFVPVPITQNAVGDGSRTFTVTLSTPGGGVNLGTTTVTTVTINDDEPDAFPAGCTAPSGFTQSPGSTTGWSVATDSTGEGSCSFKSNPMAAPGGACGPYNRAQTQFTGQFLAGNINFKARVSSEGAFDCLRFSIDGVNQNIGSCPGGGGLGLTAPQNQTETGWQAFSIPVTAGTRTVRWSYEIDCFTDGENAAWIDGVSMPLDLGPPTINLAASTTAVNENAGTATITVNRGGTTTDAIGVTWNAANGTATAGQDYGTEGNGTPPGGLLSWGAGENGPKNIVIPILQNTAFESPETFTVTLSSPTGGASLGATTVNTVTITDDDSTFDLAASTVNVTENGPNTSLTINRTGSLATTATVTYTTSNGTAISGTDYGTTVTPPSEVVTFGPGVGSRTIAIGPTSVAAPYLRTINDTTVEGSKSFTLSLGSPTGGGALGTTTSATITIHSEDGNYVMASSMASVAENAPSVQLQVNRTATVGALTVPYTFTNGTAINGTHFTGVGGNLNWDQGDNTPRFITVPIIDNGVVNTNRTFTVTLGTPTSGTTPRGSPFSTTVTITENDGTLQFTGPTFSGTEGATVNVTVSRLGDTTGTASVAFTTVNGTAEAGTDYTANSGTLNWGAGDATNKTIPVALLGDSVATGNRTFQVQLQAPVTGATLGATTLATVTRVDNDAGIKFQLDGYTVAENTANAVLSVIRVGPTTAAMSATWATTNGSATAGTDFGTNGSGAQRTGSLSWTAGDATAKTITIPILNDATGGEGSETFNVTLTPGAGVVIAGTNPVTVTITDDDILPQTSVQFTAGKVNVLEDAGSAVLTVTRTNLGGGFGLQSTVNFSMTPGSALATSDYTASSGMLTWPPGDSTAKTITIPIVNNATAESPEAFKVTLATPSAGTGLGTNKEVTVTILDEDEVFPPDGAMPAWLFTPLDADAGWHVSNDAGAFEGVYSLKTDPIGNGQSAALQMERTFVAGPVNFRVKISSEPGFDTLQFFVDGVLKQTWSGTAVPGWQAATTVNLEAGFRVLRWVYSKDASASVGADAAHIDALTTPTFTP